MADIERTETSDYQQYVTGDMVEDAANMLGNHYVALRTLFTGIIFCTCGECFKTMKQFREHVAEIILTRHTIICHNAILNRKVMQNNPSVSQYVRDIISAVQKFMKKGKNDDN